MTSFPNLMSAGTIGTLKLRNRIVMPGMGVFLGDESLDGQMNEEQLAHFAERARGGAGLVLVEVSAVMFPVGATTRRQPGLSTDAHEASFAELARLVHGHGGALGVQLVHHGKVAKVDVAEGRPLLVPSANAQPALAYDMTDGMTASEVRRLIASLGDKPAELHEADEADLEEVIAAFGSAALRARRAGLDCVEIHGAHGYVISSFLSRAYNQRTDRWGGSAENRARLLCEVIRSVKARAGADFPVIVRLDGAEFRVAGGITIAEACVNAAQAEEAGADAIHVSAYADPTSGVAFTDAPLPWQEGQYVDLVAAVRGHVNVPVIAVGRILPERAEGLVAEGTAQFVAMGRQLLADPDLPAKLSEDDPESVRPCINCFVCVASAFFDEPSACAVNGHMGRQATTPLTPAVIPRRVVVVGGGPAGLECARVAARRGHRVTLLEKEELLGGAALVSGPVNPLNAALVRFLERDARAASIDIRTGAPATAAAVAALEPDDLVIATGAVWSRPDVPGAEGANVRAGADLKAVLAADELGTKVVVVGGGMIGLEVAEWLRGRGSVVTVLEPGAVLGVEMAHPRRARAVYELRTGGVELCTYAELVSIDESAVAWRDAQGVEHTEQADQVIVTTGATARGDAASDLAPPGCNVHVIGDAAGLGHIQGAIRSGFDLARRL